MAKRALLATTRDRCQSFSKEERSRILDEFTGVAGHHRKDGIRLLLSPRTASGRSVPQRDGACYDEAVRAWDTIRPLAVLLQMLQFPVSPYPSTGWMVQRLTSRRLASSRWLTPFDRSTRMYSRCCSVRLGRRPGKRPSVRALAWPATERSLIEFRHHSLKASTIWSWSLPLAVAVSKSSDRERNSTPLRCRSSITCGPQVSPVNGGAKVDRAGGRLLTSGG